MGLDQRILINKKGFDIQKEEHIKEYYFRKVNCLHGYFDRKYNIDNFEYQKIDMEDIKYLNQITEQILKTKDIDYAKENLPTYEGFFFGSYDYDEYYFMDIQEVNDVTNEIMNMNIDDYELFYWHWY